MTTSDMRFERSPERPWGELESPFLDEEALLEEPGSGHLPHRTVPVGESPFLRAFETEPGPDEEADDFDGSAFEAEAADLDVRALEAGELDELVDPELEAFEDEGLEDFGGFDEEALEAFEDPDPVSFDEAELEDFGDEELQDEEDEELEDEEDEELDEVEVLEEEAGALDVEGPEDFEWEDHGTALAPGVEELLSEQELPSGVPEALRDRDWPRALELAIRGGLRDENELANLVFFARHPELGGRRLEETHPQFRRLSREWAAIRNREVTAAIRKASVNRSLVVSGRSVTAGDAAFRGSRGKRFKELVARAAEKVDINPGLLAANLIAETGRGGRSAYLTRNRVSSYHLGTDDYYARRTAIARRVPAAREVGWDRRQRPVEHFNDAKKPRRVKTIRFDSGPDGLLASAVYLKYCEVRLREEAAKRDGDFDALSLETRWALTRMAFNAGVGGATRRLVKALAGRDVLVRRNIARKKYGTDRNATIHTARALHLSDWIFGVDPTKPKIERETVGVLHEAGDPPRIPYESALRHALAHLQPKALHTWSDGSVTRGFGAPWWTGKFNHTYWETATDPAKKRDDAGNLVSRGWRMLEVRSGKSPYDAFIDLPASSNDWTFECASYIQAAHLYALARSNGRPRTESWFRTRKARLRYFWSPGIKLIRSYRKQAKGGPWRRWISQGRWLARPGLTSTQLVTGSPVGSRMMWHNVKGKGSWKNENAVKVGRGWYRAFPLFDHRNASGRQIGLGLATYGYVDEVSGVDRKALEDQVFDDMSHPSLAALRTYWRENVFLREVDVLGPAF